MVNGGICAIFYSAPLGGLLSEGVMSLHENHKYHAANSGAKDPKLQRVAKRCTFGGWNVTTEENGTLTQNVHGNFLSCALQLRLN